LNARLIAFLCGILHIIMPNMDSFEVHLLQEEQHRLMTTQAPLQDVKRMLGLGLKPMITKEMRIIWGELVDGKMVPYMTKSKNAQGIETSNPVPVEAIFVGSTSNPQLSSMGNVRDEKAFPMIPSQMHYTEGAQCFQECQLDMWDFDPMVDIESNEVATGFSKSKAKQGLTLVAPPASDDFDSRTVLERVFGKRGLIIDAMAYFASQPENRALLQQRFGEIARSYTIDQQSSVYRAVFDDLTGKSNGYHFGYEGKGGAVTLPVYGNMMFESVKKDRDGKRIKPDNEKYLNANFDPTGSLTKIFKRMYPRATYRPLKKTDLRGNELGFAPGDQARLQKLHNPVVALVLKARMYFNSYNSFTLDVEPDHSGIKILYDGDDFTPAEVATFEEWKKTGTAPPRFQINMAMASDLSATLEKANSEAMKARREEFYRKRGGAPDQLAIQATSTEDADADAFFASVDADTDDYEGGSKRKHSESE